MTLAPYARQVARVAVSAPQRWPDIPAGATRQVAIDASDWSAQVDADPPISVTATITPSDAGLTLSAEDVEGTSLVCTLAATTTGIGADYAVVLTATTAGGRIEPFAARILVTDPTA